MFIVFFPNPPVAILELPNCLRHECLRHNVYVINLHERFRGVAYIDKEREGEHWDTVLPTFLKTRKCALSSQDVCPF